MGSDALTGANNFGSSAQFGFVHDANRLYQPVAQHVGGVVFGKYKKFFQWDMQVLGDQFEGVNPGVVDTTLKAGQVMRVDSDQIGKLFLSQATLLAKLLDPLPDFLLRCLRHSARPSCVRVISHRGSWRNSVQGVLKFELCRRKTFTCVIIPRYN